MLCDVGVNRGRVLENLCAQQLVGGELGGD